jgi:hypothetical protein
MPDAKLLNIVQDKVFADKRFWPKEDDSDHMTFCNLATIAVAQGIGCHALDSPQNRQPLLADEIYQLFVTTPAVFTPLAMRDSQDRVNAGGLVFAVLPGWKLQESHGHICTLTPGVGDHSGRWNAFTPFCLNLGRPGTCFRRKGVNWAFQFVPEFFVWNQT